MTDNSSIDLSVANIWHTYLAFRKGKRPSRAIALFEYELLANIQELSQDLQSGGYRHGDYTHMIVSDNKRRDIAVADVRDRVVHRLLYDYLGAIWDKTFIYDAWSCRKGKGLHAALARAQYFMNKYRSGWVWRADISKFFDSVNRDVLKRLIRRRVANVSALWLLDEVIDSFGGRGIPIGNLTSQIFANIYMNEFDRYISQDPRSLAYLRYGDDWLCFCSTKNDIEDLQCSAEQFLLSILNLPVHLDLNKISPAKRGVRYLGVRFWPSIV